MDGHHVSPDSAAAAEPSPGAPPRRSFLRLGGALIGAGALASPLAAATAAAADRRTGQAAGGRAGVSARARPAWLSAPDLRGPSMADWAALRRTLSTHEVILPGQGGYGLARELYDPRFDSLRPAGVAYCGTPADVAACLSFAARFGLLPRPRSGGHSYAGWSSGNGVLIVDISRLSSFSVGTGTVTVGTGLPLINFYQLLAARGLAVPGGSCPTVGIAGLTLGGGVGVLSRIYGLTSDNLTALQIVTADGSVLNCDGSHNSDLFWACRGGGGGNFGVNTSFTFRTHGLRQLILFGMSWPWSQAARVVSAWQSWAPGAPDALWSNLALSCAPGGFPSIAVGGSYVGSQADAERLLGQLYALVGSGPSRHNLLVETYLNAMLVAAGCPKYSVAECHRRPGGRLPRVPSYAKSDFFTRKLDANGIRALLSGIEGLRRVRGAAGGLGATAFDAFGGALNRVRPDATAFVHRDALFDAQYSTSWNYPGSPRGVANQHAWLRSYYASVHPHASGQAYQNYVDPDLTNWRQAYYGANYPQLSVVKGKYDRKMLFNFPQAITPPGSGLG